MNNSEVITADFWEKEVAKNKYDVHLFTDAKGNTRFRLSGVQANQGEKIVE